MYQELVNAAGAIWYEGWHGDTQALMRAAYQAMLIAVDSQLTSDAAEDDDLLMAMAGQIADWLVTQQGHYPNEAQRERILTFVQLFVEALWNHRFGRSAAAARDQQKVTLLSFDAAISTPESRPQGRPSQGRSRRIAALITDDLFEWIDTQRGPRETLSDAIYRLLLASKS